MINIVICDDDPSFITSFSAQLSGVLDKLHVEFKLSALHKISNLYNELSEGMYYDIIFLDIEFFLEDKSGIDLSRYLRDNLRIAEKYEGSIVCDDADGVFKISVMLMLPSKL